MHTVVTYLNDSSHPCPSHALPVWNLWSGLGCQAHNKKMIKYGAWPSSMWIRLYFGSIIPLCSQLGIQRKDHHVSPCAFSMQVHVPPRSNQSIRNETDDSKLERISPSIQQNLCMGTSMPSHHCYNWGHL